MFNFKKFLSDTIDEARADLWNTDKLVSCQQPTDYFDKAHARQQARAEIYGAIMDYREERIDFCDLLMALQAFDKTVTPDDVNALLGRGVKH